MDLLIRKVQPEDAEAIVSILNPIIESGTYTVLDTPLSVKSEREYITREPVIRPGVYVVNKELPNPAINVGHHIKVDRTAPMEDHAAIEILNDILGGSGFRSRLMERLRSDEGLTYGIYSYIQHQGRPGQPGAVVAFYQTGKETVGYSISSVMEEMRRIVEHDVTAAEVQEQSQLSS